MFHRSALNGTGKLNRLFKTAIGDLHLVVNEPFLVERVAAAATDAQAVLVYLNLQLIDADAGQIELDDPAFVGSVNISGRIPKSTGRAHLPVQGQHGKATISVRHGKRIRRKIETCKERPLATDLHG